MQIRILSQQIATEYDGTHITRGWFAEYIAGCEQLIVPGVIGWANVQAEQDHNNDIVLTADITTEDVVTGNPEYNGDEVSEEFIRSYILGADVYWLAPEVLRATEVTFA